MKRNKQNKGDTKQGGDGDCYLYRVDLCRDLKKVRD